MANRSDNRQSLDDGLLSADARCSPACWLCLEPPMHHHLDAGHLECSSFAQPVRSKAPLPASF